MSGNFEICQGKSQILKSVREKTNVFLINRIYFFGGIHQKSIANDYGRFIVIVKKKFGQGKKGSVCGNPFNDECKTNVVIIMGQHFAN